MRKSKEQCPGCGKLGGPEMWRGYYVHPIEWESYREEWHTFKSAIDSLVLCSGPMRRWAGFTGMHEFSVCQYCHEVVT